MNNQTQTKRVIYTASDFAKNTLIYLQEAGKTKSLKKHTSSRNNLNSYLFFIVTEGNGTFIYNKNSYNLKKNDCVFIDCSKGYSHTSDNWSIEWVHFNNLNLEQIYNKYLQRQGKNVFTTDNLTKYTTLIEEILNISESNEYTKDMSIYSKITELLSFLMQETIYTENNNQRIYDIEQIKKYLDSNYTKDISLDSLSRLFTINKFYLTRLFKDTYGITIINYINNKRITKAKQLLRFTDLSIEQISNECGIKDENYFSRLFKKIENTTPNKYRNMW